MYGIATAGNSSISDYNNRIVLLEVIGALNAKARNTHYTMKVPYARLSQTVQRISRAGGKIASVTMASFSPSETVGAKTVERTPAAKTVEVTEKAVTPETVVIEIAPQPALVDSKQDTSKAKGMGEKQPRNTKRDRKPKSRQ
jgi:CpcD/allophycocyanin linker domain